MSVSNGRRVHSFNFSHSMHCSTSPWLHLSSWFDSPLHFCPPLMHNIHQYALVYACPAACPSHSSPSECIPPPPPYTQREFRSKPLPRSITHGMCHFSTTIDEELSRLVTKRVIVILLYFIDTSCPSVYFAVFWRHLSVNRCYAMHRISTTKKER